MKKRILVVDDDIPVRESLKKVLMEAGYEVVLASSGEEAIVRFASNHIDLMILDLGLPFKDGWDVFEEVTRKNPYIPIVVITGLANQYDVSVAAGVDALLEKPIEAPVLLAVVEKTLAEPKENRLRRLCGYLRDTRYVPSANTVFRQRLSERAAAPYRFDLPRARWQGTKP